MGLRAAAKTATKSSKTPVSTCAPKRRTLTSLTSRRQTSSSSAEMILDETTRKALQRIRTHPSLTPHRRLVYRTLLSVPRGRWTTYAILSEHLSSAPRAIGNAMRANPFSPDVPCHRVLATNRTIGGYKGDWGNGGSYAVEKTKLLDGEGVVFDGMGRASGEAFRDFVDMETTVKGDEKL